MLTWLKICVIGGKGFFIVANVSDENWLHKNIPKLKIEISNFINIISRKIKNIVSRLELMFYFIDMFRVNIVIDRLILFCNQVQ